MNTWRARPLCSQLPSRTSPSSAVPIVLTCDPEGLPSPGDACLLTDLSAMTDFHPSLSASGRLLAHSTGRVGVKPLLPLIRVPDLFVFTGRKRTAAVNILLLLNAKMALYARQHGRAAPISSYSEKGRRTVLPNERTNESCGQPSFLSTPFLRILKVLFSLLRLYHMGCFKTVTFKAVLPR